jgi:hypothetical protein
MQIRTDSAVFTVRIPIIRGCFLLFFSFMPKPTVQIIQMRGKRAPDARVSGKISNMPSIS